LLKETLNWDNKLKVAAEESIKIWYVSIAGKQAGPYTYEEVNEKLEANEITYDDYIFKEGMSQWVRIGSLPQFGSRTPYVPTGNTARNAKIPELPKEHNLEKIWYFYNVETEEQQGPLSFDQIDAAITRGKFSFNDYVWTERFGEEWKRIAEVPEFDRRNLQSSKKSLPPKISPFSSPPVSGVEDSLEEEELFSSGVKDIVPPSENEAGDAYGAEFEPLELTRGAESEFETNLNDPLYNLAESEDSATADTKTSINKSSKEKDFNRTPTISEEDCFTGVINEDSSHSSLSGSKNSSSITMPEIPDDVSDSLNPKEPSYHDDADIEFENTFSSDVFTESIEGETSCSMVDIDSDTEDTIKKSSEDVKTKVIKKEKEKTEPKGKKGKKRLKKFLLLVFIIWGMAEGTVYIYRNFNDFKGYLPFKIEDLDKFLPKILVSGKLSLFSNTKIDTSSSSAGDVLKTYENELNGLSSNELKDNYILKIIGSDKKLGNPINKNLIELSKKYPSKNYDIKLLQLIHNTNIQILKARAGMFKKALKLNKLSVSLFTKRELMLVVAELYMKNKQDIFAISWYKLAIDNTSLKTEQAKIYETIGDIYSGKNKFKAASLNYNKSIKLFQNPAVLSKLKTSKAKEKLPSVKSKKKN